MTDKPDFEEVHVPIPLGKAREAIDVLLECGEDLENELLGSLDVGCENPSELRRYHRDVEVALIAKRLSAELDALIHK
jgi:hypothetical protein